MTTTIYEATATREGSWWLIRIPQLDLATQSRRLDQVAAAAQDLIAVWLEVPEDSFAVTVIPKLDDVTRRAAGEVKALQAYATRATEQAAAAARRFASSLLAQGYTVRDAGAILSVSPQRISQLTSAPERQVAPAPSPVTSLAIHLGRNARTQEQTAKAATRIAKSRNIPSRYTRKAS